MRPSNLIAAALTCATSLAWAADSTTTSTGTVLIPATVAGTSSSCTTIPSTLRTPPLPSDPSSATSTANWTLTILSTLPGSSSLSIASYTDDTTAPTNTTAAASSSTSSPAVVGTNAAAPGDGFAGDSSMLGLVVFFALSLCLL